MRLTLVGVALLLLAGCGGAPVRLEPTGGGAFALSSAAFADNTPIPAEYTCRGRNVPPPLAWVSVPAGTAALALVVDDPDAPAGLFIHWVVTGISPSTTRLGDGGLPAGATVGQNSAGDAGYFGPCPPAGTGVHHYRFQLYALGSPLAVAATASAPEAARAIAEAATAVTRLVGLYGG